MELPPHFNQSGRPQLPDLSAKSPTRWEARALAIVSMTRATLERIIGESENACDVLSVAAIGGVLGARKASDIVPVCPQTTITAASVDFEVNMTLAAVNVIVTVKGTGLTGVDSQALAGACAAALTIYELCKDADREVRIEQVCLTHQTEGLPAAWPLAGQAQPVDPAEEEAVLRPRLTLVPGTGVPVPAKRPKAKGKRKAPAKRKAPSKRKKVLRKAKAKPKVARKTKAKAKPKAKPKVARKTKAKVKPKAKPKTKTKLKTLRKPKTKAKSKAKAPKGRWPRL